MNFEKKSRQLLGYPPYGKLAAFNSIYSTTVWSDRFITAYHFIRFYRSSIFRWSSKANPCIREILYQLICISCKLCSSWVTIGYWYIWKCGFSINKGESLFNIVLVFYTINRSFNIKSNFYIFLIIRYCFY